MDKIEKSFFLHGYNHSNSSLYIYINKFNLCIFIACFIKM